MTSSMLPNLFSAWGVNPNNAEKTSFLPGLIGTTERILEERAEHLLGQRGSFEAMLQRIRRRRGELVSLSRRLRPFVGLLADFDGIELVVKENLEAFGEVEEALELFLDTLDGGETEECWEQLGALEESSEYLRESLQEMTTFA